MKMKKIIVVTLATVMLLSLPMSVSAEEILTDPLSEETLTEPLTEEIVEELLPEETGDENNVIDSGTFEDYNQNIITWSLAADGTLTISGKGIVVYDSSWLSYKDEITKIILEEGITQLYSEAISCNSVTELKIPASVTTIYPQYTGDNPEGYFRADSLENIIVDENNQNFSSKDGVLYNKDKTKLIYYPYAKNGDTFDIPSGVEEIGYNAFFDSRLTKITIPETVTIIGNGAFPSCENLESIIIPDNVTMIGEWAFWRCTKLEEIVFPSSITNIGYESLKDCENLKKITILNKMCDLSEDGLGLKSSILVYGYTGSTAEAYAKRNGNPFVALDEGNVVSEIKVNGIKISGDYNKVAAGKKTRLIVDVLPSNASNKEVVWQSSNSKVATVDNSGVVTMKKGSGGKSVTITAIAKDGSGIKGTYKLTSMKGVVKKISISGKKTVKAGKTLKLKGKVSATKKANKKLKWTSSNVKYAKVNSSGKVITYKAGKGKKVKITAMSTDGSNKKKSVTIKIK